MKNVLEKSVAYNKQVPGVDNTAYLTVRASARGQEYPTDCTGKNTARARSSCRILHHTRHTGEIFSYFCATFSSRRQSIVKSGFSRGEPNVRGFLSSHAHPIILRKTRRCAVFVCLCGSICVTDIGEKKKSHTKEWTVFDGRKFLLIVKASGTRGIFRPLFTSCKERRMDSVKNWYRSKSMNFPPQMTSPNRSTGYDFGSGSNQHGDFKSQSYGPTDRAM